MWSVIPQALARKPGFLQSLSYLKKRCCLGEHFLPPKVLLLRWSPSSQPSSSLHAALLSGWL